MSHQCGLGSGKRDRFWRIASNSLLLCSGRGFARLLFQRAGMSEMRKSQVVWVQSLLGLLLVTLIPGWVRAESSIASPVPEDARVSSESIAQSSKYDPVPTYQKTRPNWAMELAGSLQAFGSNSKIVGKNDSRIRAIQVHFEYQPAFLQSLGVIGIGPNAAFYPVSSPGSVTQSQTLTRGVFGLYSYGAHARYQARFFREQPIVPTAGLGLGSLHYKLSSGLKGSVSSRDTFIGAMFLLNVLEPSAAAEFYVNQGVSRSYLVAEYHTITGDDSVLSLDGRSLYVGIRIEF